MKYTIITLALVSYLLSSVARALQGLGSIPAGGPVVDEFFSTVPGWFFDMCMIQLELKTHLPFRIRGKYHVRCFIARVEDSDKG